MRPLRLLRRRRVAVALFGAAWLASGALAASAWDPGALVLAWWPWWWGP